MPDNPKGGELDPADDVRMRCKKNSSVLSCIGKSTNKGCDRGSEIGQFAADKREGPVPPRKPKEYGKQESYE